MKIEKLTSNLKLTNDGGLSLFFIGVGSAFSKKHFQNNLLIVKGDDHLLVDCGITCPSALYHYGSNITNIRNILITHSHADHIGGLEEAGLMGRYVTKQRPRMFITKQYKKILWNQSLRGGNSYGEMNNGRFLGFDDYFELVEPKQIQKKPRLLWETNCGSINIKIYRTKHIPDCVGSWKKAFYSVGVLIDGVKSGIKLSTEDFVDDLSMVEYNDGFKPAKYNLDYNHQDLSIDYSAHMANYISITPLTWDKTHNLHLQILKDKFE